MIVVLVTGGFDPLHSGHIAYFKAAKELGDRLIVGLNSDEWLTRKKDKPFMPFEERAAIIRELSVVDDVIEFDDSDNTACAAIKQVMLIKQRNCKVVFANGGDRTNTTTPEYAAYGERKDVEFVFGVGGEDKKNSSSWILKDWAAPKITRSWGHYRNLYKGDGFQVKELVINPHSKLSMQKHQHRSETWNLVSGTAHVVVSYDNEPTGDSAGPIDLFPDKPINIHTGVWHQGCNDSDEPAHIVEVWKGKSELMSEEDITRWDAE